MTLIIDVVKIWLESWQEIYEGYSQYDLRKYLIYVHNNNNNNNKSLSYPEKQIFLTPDQSTGNDWCVVQHKNCGTHPEPCSLEEN